jgi:hypothetical protein
VCVVHRPSVEIHTRAGRRPRKPKSPRVTKFQIFSHASGTHRAQGMRNTEALGSKQTNSKEIGLCPTRTSALPYGPGIRTVGSQETLAGPNYTPGRPGEGNIPRPRPTWSAVDAARHICPPSPLFVAGMGNGALIRGFWVHPLNAPFSTALTCFHLAWSSALVSGPGH